MADFQSTRVVNTDVIPMRFRNGTWKLRKRMPGGKRIEVSLGTADRAIATKRAKLIILDASDGYIKDAWAQRVAEGLQSKGWIKQLAINVRHRSKRLGGPGLTIAMLEQIALRSNGKCEVSGIPFYVGPDKKQPFQASIDRRDSSRGYEPDNCRMVALAVNLCMSEWGERVFLQISAAVTRQQLEAMASGTFPTK